MFPNIKKSQDSYTNYLNETMQSNSSVYNNHPPSVLLLYTTVWSTPENWIDVWLENFTCNKNQKPNNMQASCYFVSTSHFTNILIRRYMGLKILAVQFYPSTPQKAQMTIPTLPLEGWDK